MDFKNHFNLRQGYGRQAGRTGGKAGFPFFYKQEQFPWIAGILLFLKNVLLGLVGQKTPICCYPYFLVNVQKQDCFRFSKRPTKTMFFYEIPVLDNIGSTFFSPFEKGF